MALEKARKHQCLQVLLLDSVLPLVSFRSAAGVLWICGGRRALLQAREYVPTDQINESVDDENFNDVEKALTQLKGFLGEDNSEF